MRTSSDTSRRRRGRVGAAAFVAVAALIGAIGLFGVAQDPGVLVASDCTRASGSMSSPPAARIRDVADVWDGTTRTQPQIAGGTATITSAAELAGLSTSGFRTVELAADIDLGGHEWTPLELPVGVTVDGKGHVIKGLRITSATGSVGLFSSLDGSVRDLHLLDVSISVSATSVGALAGELSGNTDITNCTAQGTISASGTYTVIGGLVGRMRAGATFSNVGADVAISNAAADDGSAAGGIVGATDGTPGIAVGASLTISNAVVGGSISGSARAMGGVVGRTGDISRSSSITNYASVTLTANADAATARHLFGAGGIVGVVEQGDALSMASCANFGVVTMGGPVGDGVAGAGGLVGTIKGGIGDTALDDPRDGAIEKSLNEGSVSSSVTAGPNNDHLGVGGIVGAIYDVVHESMPRDAISLTANLGSVSATQTNISAGGLVGYISAQAGQAGQPDRSNVICQMHSSYNRGGVSALGGTAGGIIGTATAQAAAPAGAAPPTVLLSLVYSSVIPTGATVGGIAGRMDVAELDQRVEYVYPDDPMLSTTGDPASQPEGKDLSDRQTFDGWNDAYNIDGVLPPGLQNDSSTMGRSEYDPYTGSALGSASVTRRDDGSIELTLYGLPNEKIRDVASVATYTVQTAGGETIASGLRAAGGTLVVPASDLLAQSDVVRISDGTNDGLLVSIMQTGEEPEPEPGEIADLFLSGIPSGPVPNGTTGVRLLFRYADDPMDARRADAPSNASAKWTLQGEVPGHIVGLSPSGFQADLNVRQTSSGMSALSVGTRAAELGTMRLVVEVTQGDKTLTLSRPITIGELATLIKLSEAAQDAIDKANSDMSASGIVLGFGNTQDPMPQESIDRVTEWVKEYLVTYGDNVSEPFGSVVPLDELSAVDAYKADPEPETLPLCFDTLDKDGLCVSMDAELGGANANDIALVPMSYTVELDADMMAQLFGSDAEDILDDPEEYIERIFDAIVLHNRIDQEADIMAGYYTRLIDGVVSPTHALERGIVSVSSVEGTLVIRLSYNMLDYPGEAFVTDGYLIVPDGTRNGEIVDPIWVNTWITARSSGRDLSGGGGCAVGSLALVAFSALCIAYRRRRGDR